MSIKSIEHGGDVSSEFEVLLLVFANGHVRGAGQSKLLVMAKAVNLHTDIIRYQRPAVQGMRIVPIEGSCDVSSFQWLFSHR